MNDWIPAVCFWICVTALVYAYVVYPAVLGLCGRPRRVVEAPRARRPQTSVIVAAFNEERVIAEKVANVLQQLKDDDELLVVSDGSTDRTEDAVAASRDPRVRLMRQEPRKGKNAALNIGAGRARGQILVFTDANAMLAQNALDHLLHPFADPAVGLVSGLGLYGQTDIRLVSSTYVRYETVIRRGEGALGFMAGVDGALYAMRRELYQELPLDQVHDLLHPIQVALAGRQVVFAPEAVTREPPSPDSASERRRQVRIIAQGFRVLAVTTPLLLHHGRLRELWMLASHRLLRWIGWLLALVALLGNMLLLDAHPVYSILFGLQVTFFVMAAAGALGERLSLRPRILALPYYFCVVSYAGFIGLVEALRGRAHTVWATGGRSV
jgi:cellulose synthase/poly-beta-1,6-N-acetylglucosamine synthase-like glycosyltransferase